MKFCSNCGNQVGDGFNVCPSCGFIFNNATPAQQPVNTPPQQFNNQPQYSNGQQFNNPPQYNNGQQFNNPPQYNNGQQFNNGPQFGGPQFGGPMMPPAQQLKTDRGLLKFILLSIITFGIYGIVVYYKMSSELNLVASRYDGKKTMNYALLIFLIAPITLGIGAIVWMHKFCARIGNELKRRQLGYDFGAKDFWLWGVLGTFIIVGPFIFAHKLFKSMNIINADYNVKG